MTRRELLAAARALAAGAFLAPFAGRPARGATLPGYPFRLGIASGEPSADGFVLWTRLAPDPPDGGMPPEAVRVRWEVARDDRMRDVVRSGEAAAVPDRAHAVHVEVRHLEPDRPYWYRFVAAGAASPIGRTRTFPTPGAAKQRMRVAWASCQHFGQGWFNAYRDMLDADLDLVLHLGDYVYEGAWGPAVRPHPPEPRTLDGYRALHALYKTDPHLQAAHAAFPWAVTWDDHEVENDYAGFHDQHHAEPQAEFVLRRAAAYRAYYEHMPLRASSLPTGPDMRLYRSLRFGDLATFAILDGRQYRSNQACPVPGRYGGRVIVDCAERLAPERSMLGFEQEGWLAGTLERADTRWRVIAQQMLMAELDQDAEASGRDVRWSDGWDGYAATRTRLLERVRDERMGNVVVLGGDIHQYFVTDLKLDPRDERAPVLATEFVGTSVTSDTGSWGEKILRRNPHVRFHDWRHRGYARAEITPSRWTTDLRAMVDVTDPDAAAFTLASFAVENGHPGAVRD